MSTATKNLSGEAPKKRNSKMLPDGPDWTFELLERYHKEIKRVAQHYRLDTYPNQIEVITSEQMMDAYSSIGMPINYTHWSFGKKFCSSSGLDGAGSIPAATNLSRTSASLSTSVNSLFKR